MAPNRIRELVRAAEASRPGIDAVAHLCSMAAEGLPVDGVGLSVTGGPGRHSKVTATDDVSGHIEDLQVLLGQGPCVDAVATGAPVLVPDLEAPGSGPGGRPSVLRPPPSASGPRSPCRWSWARCGSVRWTCTGPRSARSAGGPRTRPRPTRALPSSCSCGLRTRSSRTGCPPGCAAGGPAYQRGAPGDRHGDGAARRASNAAAFAALRARAYREDRRWQDVARDVIERRSGFDGRPK